MPANLRPVVNERDGLLSFLAQQRLLLQVASFGLSDEGARATPTPSTLSVGGTIKHVAAVERYWMDLTIGKARGESSEANYQDNFHLAPGETLDDVLDSYALAATNTEAVITAVPDLGQPVPVPQDVPWFPKDIVAWSVRWVLFHLIEETARHVGHVDIVREALDGATAVPLLAAYEGWPATPWVTPWKRLPAPPVAAPVEVPAGAGGRG
ncbi:MAG: DinB family protein [Candidatus Dormibacteria bacterium]